MPKRPDHSSDLLTIGMFAPLVIATRLQMLAAEAVRPTASGRRETRRMVAEKPTAALDGALAAHRSMLDSGLSFWTAIAAAWQSLLFAAPANAMALATVPVRRRVRGNARRLTGL
jgi:hypothetical protein